MTMTFALVLVFGLITVAGAGVAQAAELPDPEDVPMIGADFDWEGISANTEYRITEEVTIGVGQTVTIPETTTIHILDGGVLTFEDCELTLLGTVHAWPGSEVVVSTTGIELDGSVVAEAGATITLKIDSADGLTYRAIAPESGDDVIIALGEGSVSFSETMVDTDEGWIFEIDGVAAFDMIDPAPINTYEVLVQEGAELSIVDDLSEEGIITNHGTVTIAEGVAIEYAGWGFTNTGTIVNEGAVEIIYDTVVNTGTITNNGSITTSQGAGVDNDGLIDGRGTWDADISGEGTIAGGVFTADVSAMLAGGYASYAVSGMNVVVAESDSPAIVIADIPFATLADALMLINVNDGEFMDVVGDDTLRLLKDMDASEYRIGIPVGSEIVIDLNGFDLEVAGFTASGNLTIDGNGGTLYGSIVLDAKEDTTGSTEGIYDVVLKDLVMDGDRTRGMAVNGQNQGAEDYPVRPVNLTLEDVDITGYTNKGVYMTNIQNLNVTGCSFNDNATTEQTWFSGDYAFDINLCGIQDAVIIIRDTSFAGVSGGNSPIKITQRGGVADNDDISTDIKSSVGATIKSVTISGCTFDITAGTGGKEPMADLVIGSSPNDDGTARTYTQAFDITISTDDAMDVAFRNGKTGQTENLLVFSLPADTEDAFISDGTITDGKGSVSVVAKAANVSGTRGAVSIVGGYYTSDVSGLLAEGLACYDYEGIKFVSESDIESPAIIIAGIPFVSLEDALVLINAESEGFMDVVDGDLVLLRDMTATSDIDITIPVGSSVTIDLDGFDLVLGDIDVFGTLSLVDDSNVPGTVTVSTIDVNGGSLTGDVTVMAESGDALVYVNGSGTVTGLTFDITPMTGGAITVSSGATGNVNICGVTVLIDGASDVDRGIYVNQTAQGGSISIVRAVFDFDGNDACPVNIDLDSDSHVDVSMLTYIDCARPNKLLVNAKSDVTVGPGGNIDFDHADDAVLWDSSESGNTFTVTGNMVLDGLLTLISNGHLVIPEDAELIVNDRIVIASDSSVTGELVFGSDRANSIVLSDVVAGNDGLTLSLGSVVMGGSVVSGSMVLNGSGLIDGDVDLGSAVLEVPRGSVLAIPSDSALAGTAQMKVAGQVSVFGSLSAPVDNTGTVTVYQGGDVSGEVTGNEVVDADRVEVSIGTINDVSIELGQDLRVAVTVMPTNAVVSATIGDESLEVNGRVITWTPETAGTYVVTVTAEFDGNVDITTFTVTVTQSAPDDDGDDFDWRIVLIVFIVVVIVILVISRIL